MLSRIRDWWSFRRVVRSAGSQQNAGAALGKDVVVIPCWRRPEFLWHCLDNLTQASGFEDLHVMFRPDTGYHPENLEVIHGFAAKLPSYEVSYPTPSPFRRTKQSANVLMGYVRAAARAKRYVFLVEEDVMVSRDFFQWHRAVHLSNKPLFCSIAAKNPHRSIAETDDLQSYYLSSKDYCPYGVCFDKAVIQRRLVPHVNMRYFSRPKPYLRRNFPGSSVSIGYVEQDGLIRRIQEAAEIPIAYPCVPRAYDAGFYGYNRPGAVEGDLQTRIRRLGETIYNENVLQEAAGPVHGKNCIPISLAPGAWESLTRLDVAWTD